MRRGEKLADVIQRAGGFTENAFVEGAVFLRESLKEQEQEQIETLARRLEADVATLVVAGGERLVARRRCRPVASCWISCATRRPSAVLVIDLRREANGIAGSAETVEMRDGDKLLVPNSTAGGFCARRDAAKHVASLSGKTCRAMSILT